MYTDDVVVTECRQAGNLAIGYSQEAKTLCPAVQPLDPDIKTLRAVSA